MSFLTLTGVQKTFPGGTVAVEDFNLEAVRGEFVSFLGPSGCGKTTTLRMIAGFEKPTAGTIVVDGTDITYRSPNQRNVGMVFQSYALFPNMTVADNIGFGLKVRKRPKSEIDKRVKELLELIHLEDRGGRFPYQMSGGQQQRVALARALAIEPQVLLLDEPLSALDAKIRIVLRKEIRAIQRQLGITTVYVTHDQEEALSLSDRVVVMSDGRIEQIGTPSEIYNFPSTAFVASFVGTLNLVNAGVIDAGTGRLSIDGQEVRTSKVVTGAGADGRVILAVRPEGISLREGVDGSNHLRGIVEDVNFLGSIVRIRFRMSDGVDDEAPTVMALDTFNEPHLKVPDVGGDGHRVVPAARRASSSGRRGTARWRQRRPARRCDRPARRHRPGRLRQGRDDHRFRLDVERLGGGPRRGAARRDRPVRGRAAVRDARLRRGDRELSCPVAGWPRRRWPACASGRGTCWSRRASSGADADRALAAAWHAPDPVGLARPLADLSALFGRLRASGRRVAIATSDDREPTERTLEALGLADSIDGLVCADDGIPVKPAPDMVLRLCADLGVDPGRTAVVGDSPADLRMGRAAGVALVVGVLTGVGARSDLESEADVVIGSVAGVGS